MNINTKEIKSDNDALCEHTSDELNVTEVSVNNLKIVDESTMLCVVSSTPTHQRSIGIPWFDGDSLAPHLSDNSSSNAKIEISDDNVELNKGHKPEPSRTVFSSNK